MRALPLLAALLVAASSAMAQQLSPLAPAPVWSRLEAYQETITREEFIKLLTEVYAPGDAAREYLEIGESAVAIKTALQPAASFTLRFAAAGQEKPVPRFWHPAAALPPAALPLAGVKIALDPGHLGGEWARMEERFFQIGESKPVTEGDLTLRVAGLLQPALEKLGATVLLVRSAATPATSQRPADLRNAASAELAATAHLPSPTALRLESEILFYRTSEIRARARLVNEQLKPDLTLCLHFNAEGWGEPQHPQFVPRNHVHVVLNGCYSAAELRHDDVRCDMLLKLLSRAFPEERAAAEPIAARLAKATGLPAYTYTTGNAVRVGETGYLWARNLLANRLYETPVVFLEPYVMNSEIVWERVQAGDYDGEISLGGVARKSIFREYADAVAEGLAEYYIHARGH